MRGKEEVASFRRAIIYNKSSKEQKTTKGMKDLKKMKKIASLLLVLAMALTMNVSVFAASGTSVTNNGKITITDPVEGQTYDIYRMFELESYNTDTNSFSYKITEEWKAFVAEEAAGAAYFTVDKDGYVTMKEGAEENIEKIAKDALAYAKEKKLSPAATLPKDGSNVAEGLALGYYLVDSSLGTLCGLTTTKPEITIAEKNSAPTIEKKVKEGDKWVDENDASIGDTVEFKATVSAKKGAVGYVIHDKMSEGLTLIADSIKVEGATKDTDYTVKTSDLTDGCTFEITFKQAYLDEITGDTNIVITYSAILNENAKISTEVNTNDVKLNYGDESKSETKWDQTKTSTYMFDLVKTKDDKTILNDAEFKLYNAQTDGTEIALVKVSDNVYRVATKAEKDASDFTAATITVGKATIKGLDSGTYWLEETKAPAGYNKLSERVEVKINKANNTATIETDKYVSGGVRVVNKTGTELPSTGGMGTKIFYVLGSVLVLGAVVLLITKKRMSAEN